MNAMYTETQNTDEAFNALVKEWIGQLVKCQKETGKTFTAELVAVKGNHLLFKDRQGRMLMDSMTSIKFMVPLGIVDQDVIREAYQALPELLTYEESEERARTRKGL
jgi:hypothetical protein